MSALLSHLAAAEEGQEAAPAVLEGDAPAGLTAEALRSTPVAMVQVFDVDGRLNDGLSVELFGLLEDQGWTLTACAALARTRAQLDLTQATQAPSGVDETLDNALSRGLCLPTEGGEVDWDVAFVNANLGEDAARGGERHVSLTVLRIDPSRFHVDAKDAWVPGEGDVEVRQVSVRAVPDTQGAPPPWRALLLQALMQLNQDDEADDPVVRLDLLDTPTLGQPLSLSFADSWRPSGRAVHLASVQVVQPYSRTVPYTELDLEPCAPPYRTRRLRVGARREDRKAQKKWVLKPRYASRIHRVQARRTRREAAEKWALTPPGLPDERQACEVAQVEELNPVTWTFTPTKAGRYEVLATPTDGPVQHFTVEVPARRVLELGLAYRNTFLEADGAAPIFPEGSAPRLSLSIGRPSSWYFPELTVPGYRWCEDCQRRLTSVVDVGWRLSAGVTRYLDCAEDTSTGGDDLAPCQNQETDLDARFALFYRRYIPVFLWDVGVELSPYAGEGARRRTEALSDLLGYGYVGLDAALSIGTGSRPYRSRPDANLSPSPFLLRLEGGPVLYPEAEGERIYYGADSDGEVGFGPNGRLGWTVGFMVGLNL
ncbi:MAG: hypothetical protein H6741_01115 [Alphaproteobacteria bacterium]|nr:hypothetical protein [Alphaproteobacteria bacterium]MCB9791299.1 hypothetical protein [Alphaproteobacteria bacterium]